MTFVSKYGKSIGSALAAVGVAVYANLSGDGNVEGDEWVAIAIATAGAVMTYIVPIVPQWPWVKSAVNAVTAVLLALSGYLLGGIDSGEWILLALAAASALGVTVAPAASDGPHAAAVGWGSDR